MAPNVTAITLMIPPTALPVSTQAIRSPIRKIEKKIVKVNARVIAPEKKLIRDPEGASRYR
jgi:hypothetical protein